jgi:hypothetical protein
MPTKSPWLGMLTVVTVIVQMLGTAACDDPVPGPIGGIILTFRSFEATKLDIQKISSIEIETDRVEVQHLQNIGGTASFITVDTQPRVIVIANQGEANTLIAQYQVPIGYVSQIRIYPRRVSLHMKTGTDIQLGVPSSNLPSWEQSGWKIEPVTNTPWGPIEEDQLIGVRALFQLDDKVLYTRGTGFKIKPTVPAAQFFGKSA